MNDAESETMPSAAGKTKPEAQVSTSAGVGVQRITRSRWKRVSGDYKGWLTIDGKRIRAMLVARTDGGQGVTLAPVQIIPDDEG
ncbi:MAG: hypothetical protein M0Z85_02545 [Gammaproteobacteria bacterium]|nr:hypothetical protein [Gammaproteobacteria bacterium]